MKNKFLLSLIGGALFTLLACSRGGSDDPAENPGTPNPPSGNPVETNPPNSNYVAAFSGQTRINRVSTSTAIQTNLITSALSSPWGITSLPDGKLLVTEKRGSMRIITTDGIVGNTITGIPAVNAGGQGGLLGLCIDPYFDENRIIYWVFSENVSGGNITAVAKGRLADNENAI